LVDGEQALDRAFAALRPAAEGELAVDDSGAQAALGGVGRLDVGDVGERPERRPELQGGSRARARAVAVEQLLDLYGPVWADG
jgi:hypothetical protein